MREILFKAKRIDNGEWVEGYYIYHIKRTPCVFNDFVRPEDEQHAIMRDGFSDWNMPRDTVHYDIDPSTICQYTGLTDKNGNKIWENDILSIAKSVDVISGNYFYPTIPYPANVKVKWDFCAWMWETIAKKKHYIGFPDAWCHYEAEVIGNIFDNPELKEGAE